MIKLNERNIALVYDDKITIYAVDADMCILTVTVINSMKTRVIFSSEGRYVAIRQKNRTDIWDILIGNKVSQNTEYQNTESICFCKSTSTNNPSLVMSNNFTT
jgi:hypothetical protein